MSSLVKSCEETHVCETENAAQWTTIRKAQEYWEEIGMKNHIYWNSYWAWVTYGPVAPADP